MIIARSFEELLAAVGPEKTLVATVGNFDGVHIGHQALISLAIRRARERGGLPLVITFDPHPTSVIGATPPLALSTLDQKLELFDSVGVAATLVLPFTKEFAAKTAEDFCRELGALGVAELLVGHDSRMGSDQASAATLIPLAERYGVSVTALPARNFNNVPVSSSAVRQALERGDINLANAMLGRHYSVRGTVIRGEGRGGPVLGFPTANIDTTGLVLPPPAIFATSARLADTPDEPMPSVTSLGRNPTFDGKRLTLETHILDFDGDIYGRPLEVHFLLPLRMEMKFDSVDELKARIAEDIHQRRELQSRQREVW